MDMCHYMSNSQFIYRMFNVYIYGKLQITTLKFGDVWILHFEVSEFEFYLLKKFGRVWILYPNVSEFGFFTH